MNRCKHRPWPRFWCGLAAWCLVFASAPLDAQSFPPYDHVFLLIMENENYNQVIGNQYAPILNALAADYGLATNYRGVADPSEPNYVAMLGGDFFGINSDDPYWFPGHTVSADNLMSQLEGAGKTWRGYFQNMPYLGYRGYCYPDKCNGIPDADTQYVAKHNGMVNFAGLQTPTELGKISPTPSCRPISRREQFRTSAISFPTSAMTCMARHPGAWTRTTRGPSSRAGSSRKETSLWAV